jgi:ferredoxin--NADP+ reductase
VALIHGVRHSWDLGYRSVFMAMQRLRDNFTYVPVVSRPEQEPVPWKGVTGHVQDFWRSGNFENVCGFKPDPANTHVFLCGSPEMIDGVTELTGPEGFEMVGKDHSGQVHIEQYWPRVSAQQNRLHSANVAG